MKNKLKNFSLQYANDCGRILIPFVEWMDEFDPCKSRNNQKSVLVRTVTFFEKGFDKNHHLLTFPISIGRNNPLIKHQNLDINSYY